MPPHSPPVIRRAAPADAAELARLRYTFRAAIGDAAETQAAFVKRCTPWMSSRLADDARWRAWVLEDSAGLATGTVWMQLVEKLPNPVAEAELLAYVTNFFVLPDGRNGGAGTRLLETLIAECESLGVHSAFLWPTLRSRALYERLGFVGEHDVMVRRIRGPATDA